MREGSVMRIVDPRTGEYLWRCPECGATIRLPSETAVRRVAQAGRCQGCRAKSTFHQKPDLVGFFLDFWARVDGWPQSNSWLDAVSGRGTSILDHAYAKLGMRPEPGDSAATWAA